MNDVLVQLFAPLCGQNLGHTWMPGGCALPICQRCTGLYLGAGIALLLHLFFRPRQTTAWRWLNGLFLLQMVPCGYHWIPQGPVLRTISGFLFACGIVSFLWLLPSARLRGTASKSLLVNGSRRFASGGGTSGGSYLLGLCAGLAGVLALASEGGGGSASVLSVLSVVGFSCFVGLVMLNLVLLALSGWQHRPGRSRSQPA